MNTKSPLTILHRTTWSALMAALIAAGAYVHVAIGPVPVTFQDAFVTLTGLVLGPIRGPLAVGLYLLAGIAGIPVFSGGKGGVAHLLGPTGGYLIGFIAIAFFSGLGSYLAQRISKTPKVTWPQTCIALAGTLVALASLYILGAGWLAYTLSIAWTKAVTIGILPFLPIGIPKCILITLLWRQLINRGHIPRG